MKLIFKTIFASAVLVLQMAGIGKAIDFKALDKAFADSGDYETYISGLQALLPSAAGDKDKAQVFWRLAKAYMTKGNDVTGKTGRRELYQTGIDYAEKAISLDPTDPDCYIWHCGCVGMECQTHNIMEQAAAAQILTKDVTVILDKLGRIDYASAWYTLAEINFNHPFKSNDTAVNYARRAIDTIAKEDLSICSYTLLARILIRRNWSAEKRNARAVTDQANFNKTYSSNIEKYAFYNGSAIPAWSSVALGNMSDKQEAKALVEYARKVYNAATYKTKTDKEDYRALEAFSKNL